jgi:hypothetical protein
MRIGMNVSRLSGQRLGVGRYLEYMLKYWGRMLDSGEEVHGYLREAVPHASLAHLNLSLKIEPHRVGPRLPGVVWENTQASNFPDPRNRYEYLSMSRLRRAVAELKSISNEKFIFVVARYRRRLTSP